MNLSFSLPYRFARPLNVLMTALILSATAVQAQGVAGQNTGTDSAGRKEVRLDANTFQRSSKLPSWVKPIQVPQAQQRSAVVIRLHDTQFMVSPRPVVFVHRVTQINDSSALGQVGQLGVDFDPTYQRLVLHQVRILRGSSVLDQTAAVQVRFLQRELGLEQGVYSGETSATMLVSDLRVGDSLEWSYSVEGINPVFADRFADTAGWLDYSPIERRYLALTHPVRRKIYWKLVGGTPAEQAEVQPRISIQGSTQTLEFERLGMPGHEPEPQLPSTQPNWPYMQFSEFPDWQSVATWAEGLFPPVNPLPDELKGVVAKLARESDPEVQSVKALQWVQNEIRYFSVSMGESSHRPHPPAQVLAQRFGDCKDKSYLLLTILKALGLQARPVLLSARAPNYPASLWPTPLAFDHVVVELNLGGKTYHLDPTRSAQVGALSNMGMVQFNADVLPISAGTTGLSKMMPTNALALNTYDVHESFKVSRMDGPAELRSIKTWTGTNAEQLRLLIRQLTPEQFDKQVMQGYDRRYPGIELADKPQVVDDTASNRVTLTTRYTVPRPLETITDGWLLSYAAPNLYGVFSLPPSFKRKHPALVLAHPYRANYRLDINWPENVSATRDNRSIRVSHPLFELVSDRQFRGNQSRFSVSFESRGDTLQPQDLPAFSQELDKAYEAIGRGVFVDKSDIRSGQDEAVKLGDRLRQRVLAAATRITATIDTGKLSGEALSDILCDRAEALAQSGQYTRALQDAEAAVRLSPALAKAWQCRGGVLLAQGEFTKALADLNKALMLGGDVAVIARYRGIARFHLGQFREAEHEFSRLLASLTNDETPDAVYHTQWWAWSLMRQGKPLPERIQKWARRVATGAWPLPALGLLTGQVTPDQILAALNMRQGDERQMNLAEAWYYIGQHHMQAGRLAQARKAFEQCRAQGVSIYEEDAGARWELEKLAKILP